MRRNPPRPANAIVRPSLMALIALIALAAAPASRAQDLTDMHPAYKVVDLEPAGFEDGIGGMDFLPDGRLAVCTWGGKLKRQGKIFLLSGVAGTGGSSVTFAQAAANLNEPLGLKVLGNDIYFMQKHELSRLSPAAGGGFTLSTAYTGFVYDSAQYHQFATGLVSKDSAFYFMATSSHPPRIESGNRGALIRIDLRTRRDGMIANGMREPNSLFQGPDGELFTTDNQGEWMPANKLIHLKQGRTYGMHGPDAPINAGRAISPPAIWIPYGDVSRAVTAPILLRSGPFQGQILAGDVAMGGLIRMQIEKVNGEYQGAVFRFASAGSLSCGMNRIIYGPDGKLYLGGIGGGGTLGGAGNWAWNSRYTGLQRLEPTGKTVFEMMAVHSLPGGFEIELTKPLAAGPVDKASFSVGKWWYVPMAAYGQGKQPTVPVTIDAVSVSLDRKRIKLDLAGFEPLKVYDIKMLGLKSEDGEAMRGPEAWYTVLNVGAAESPSGFAAADSRGPVRPLAYSCAQGVLRIALGPEDEGKAWRLVGLDGRTLASGLAPSGELTLRTTGTRGIASFLVRRPSGAWQVRARIFP